MSEIKIKIDDREVQKALDSLSVNNLTKPWKEGMKKSFRPVQQATVRNLKSYMGKRATRVHKSNKIYSTKSGQVKAKSVSTSLQKGVRLNVFDDQKNGLGVKVHILGDYRLKWYEKGTKQPKPKTTTVHIQPRWFFRDAVQQTQQKAFDDLEKNILEAIQKAWDKKH